MQETTQNGMDTWKASIEMARDHFEQGFNDLGKAAQQAKSQGQDAWRMAREHMREAWHEARAKSGTTWDETRERGEELIESSRHYVAHNPLKAVGYSALAGLVLGLWLSSGRQREIQKLNNI